MAVIFAYDNKAEGATITSSSEVASLPDDSVITYWKSKVWRTSGNFVITASNNKIDFQETAITPLVATLTAGTYTPAGLAAEIKTQLEISGASTYTVTYSTSTYKFTIASNGVGGGGIFELLWNTGANTAISIAGTTGYDNAADDTGALTYTADNIRIHSEEWIKFDLGSALPIQFVALVGHNLTSAAVVHIQAHATDAWSAPTIDVTLAYNADILLYYWAANQSYRWWRFTFADAANPDGYIEVGHILIGDVWEPDRNAVGFTYQYVDPSEVSESPDGAESADVKEPFLVMSLDFKRIDTDDLDTMIRDVGMNKRFYVMPDYGNAIKDDGLHDFTRYGRFISLGSSPWQFKKKYDRTLVFQEARQ